MEYMITLRILILPRFFFFFLLPLQGEFPELPNFFTVAEATQIQGADRKGLVCATPGVMLLNIQNMSRTYQEFLEYTLGPEATAEGVLDNVRAYIKSLFFAVVSIIYRTLSEEIALSSFSIPSLISSSLKYRQGVYCSYYQKRVNTQASPDLNSYWRLNPLSQLLQKNTEFTPKSGRPQERNEPPLTSAFFELSSIFYNETDGRNSTGAHIKVRERRCTTRKQYTATVMITLLSDACAVL